VKKLYILSLDLGTTAIKVAVVSEEGSVVGKGIEEYSLLTPSPLEVELPVEVYWKSFKVALGKALSESRVSPNEIKALGMSVQGETMVLVDKNGDPIHNAIVWLDNRAQEEANILAKEFGDKTTYEVTGQVKIVPTWPAAKIFWLKRHKRDVFDNTTKFLLLEDYFLYKLTGKFVAEGSLLCSTVYWNIRTKDWWKEMLDFLGVGVERLPEIREPGEVVGSILPNVADELGLNKNMIVVTGALDQAAGAVGVGNIRPGILSENTGAALAICATVEKPFVDPKFRMPCHYHAIPNLYMAHTFTTGGMVLKWYRDKFCEDEIAVSRLTGRDPYDILSEEASQVPPGSGGLIMLPHLEGAMAPEANPKAKGVFFGFTLHHGKPHFARSVMEGIACIVKRNVEVLNDLGMQFDQIICLGGGAKSPLWNQIKADLLNMKLVTTMNDQDAACLGAAMIAGKAVGIYNSLDETSQKIVKVREEFLPQQENVQVYRDLYQKYVGLYESLVNLFEVS